MCSASLAGAHVARVERPLLALGSDAWTATGFRRLFWRDQPVVPVVAAVDDISSATRCVGEEHESLPSRVEELDGAGDGRAKRSMRRERERDRGRLIQNRGRVKPGEPVYAAKEALEHSIFAAGEVAVQMEVEVELVHVEGSLVRRELADGEGLVPDQAAFFGRPIDK